MQRVLVVGTSGSGKTTLAARLARVISAPHIELDALQHGPSWAQTPPEELRTRVRERIGGERWVVDGNYAVVRSLVLERADTVIWLDYPLPLVLWRMIRRTLGRALRRTELWNGNRESLWMHLCTRDSLFLWVLRTHGRRRREFSQLMGALPPGIRMHRFQRPGETERFLHELER